jgi:hypothetical protein
MHVYDENSILLRSYEVCWIHDLNPLKVLKIKATQVKNEDLRLGISAPPKC